MNPPLLKLKSSIGVPPLPTTIKFLGIDSEEGYLKNLSDIEYRNKWQPNNVEYRMNSSYYRCAEWDQIDWNNSILLFGDSYAFGVGLAESDTISVKLSNQIGLPVVNLGQRGTGWAFSWINSNRLYAQGIRPRAVVYIWSQISRHCHFVSPDIIENVGFWNRNDIGHELGLEYMLDYEHSRATSIEYLRSIKNMWSCPQLHYTWDSNPEIDGIVPLKKYDKARDLKHAGPRTTHVWASQMSRNLSGKL